MTTCRFVSSENGASFLVPQSMPGIRVFGGAVVGLQRSPTDPIGNFILTLTNVVIGSSIQIETQDGSSTLYNGIASSSSPTVNLSAYAPGSLFNALRIKVRKGTSSPYYQPYETLTTGFVGSQSIYVSQTPDE